MLPWVGTRKGKLQKGRYSIFHFPGASMAAYQWSNNSLYREGTAQKKNIFNNYRVERSSNFLPKSLDVRAAGSRL